MILHVINFKGEVIDLERKVGSNITGLRLKGFTIESAHEAAELARPEARNWLLESVFPAFPPIARHG